MADDKPFFAVQNLGFTDIDIRDDLLHPEQNRLISADSLTETQYFGFSVPEAGIHAMTYLWHHPNLRVLSGGAWVWSGIKQNAVHSELCDIRSYMNDSAIANDLHEYRLENGYGVKIIEPLKRFHITYSDPARGNAFDLIHEAVSPAVKFGDGLHFEQAMHVSGSLSLRGKRYKVDCFNVRDRSWGKPRTEAILPLPPASWMTAVFDRDFCFNCNVFDQSSENPELTGAFAVPTEKTLNGGWLYRDGRVGRIVSARKRVEREPGTFLPKSAELTAQDEFGRRIETRGTLIAANTWQTWGNVNIVVCLMRWECEGQIAYGDFQDGVWNDYYNLMASQ